MQLFFKGDKFHLAIDIEQKVFCSDVTEPLVEFPEELESHDYIELSSLQDFRKLPMCSPAKFSPSHASPIRAYSSRPKQKSWLS